jgi:hypothetical protein
MKNNKNENAAQFQIYKKYLVAVKKYVFEANSLLKSNK